jgi:hypothetical protein
MGELVKSVSIFLFSAIDWIIFVAAQTSCPFSCFLLTWMMKQVPPQQLLCCSILTLIVDDLLVYGYLLNSIVYHVLYTHQGLENYRLYIPFSIINAPPLIFSWYLLQTQYSGNSDLYFLNSKSGRQWKTRRLKVRWKGFWVLHEFMWLTSFFCVDYLCASHLSKILYMVLFSILYTPFKFFDQNILDISSSSEWYH